MTWFWLAFFALVALLLVLDLGVLHRKNAEPSLRSAAMWTLGWITLGLSFGGFVYLMYDNHWLGVTMKHTPAGKAGGGDAATTYVSAYLLEQALSVDNLFVIALVFQKFRVPMANQHRVLFWGIIGAVVFRVAMLGGGVFLAKQFEWIFYVFGAWLVVQAAKLLRDDDEDPTKHWLVRLFRRFVRIVEGDYGSRFVVRVDGRLALTTVAFCLVTVELTDVIFAMDSIPAVLSLSQETFIVVTSNVFAIMGLRSLYFVLAGAMQKFRYLKLALAVLLVGIGIKLALHAHVHISHVVSLIAIAAVLAVGVTASVIATRRERRAERAL